MLFKKIMIMILVMVFAAGIAFAGDIKIAIASKETTTPPPQHILLTLERDAEDTNKNMVGIFFEIYETSGDSLKILELNEKYAIFSDEKATVNSEGKMSLSELIKKVWHAFSWGEVREYKYLVGPLKENTNYVIVITSLGKYRNSKRMFVTIGKDCKYPYGTCAKVTYTYGI